ncbi:retrotransposon ty3-gypsy subclass [Cystoisospora suis]|uniref:Retrotransposon ty3-gypsy subclass n=1 Tax=Cystoisospora suis TaxID=483139 RepID=A0A2C6KI58_9APIC|nr:retrotransposon ty3-gypsy subclass [Cystoisospora suis]
MPSGLAGAPSTFQRMMQHVFIREGDEFVIVYLDDVLVYPRSGLEHYNHMRIVLQRLRENRLYVGVTKCEFAKQKVHLLGFRIEPGGIASDPYKVNTIREWPVELGDPKQLRGFLGMIGYYRRLIPNFNKTASVLCDLLQEKSDMIWWPKHTKAVETLKSDLAELSQVKLFDPDKDIVIKTDASEYAVGAVLEHDGQRNAFEPPKLGPREQGLPAYDAELLAVVHALMKWKHFIGDRKVTVETDHATLGSMLVQKEVSPRLGYCLDKLAEFNLNVVYKPCRQNIVADAISNESMWEELLPIAEFAYNSRVHTSTKSDLFGLLYGFVPTPPICRELSVGAKVALQMLPRRANVLLEKAMRELLRAQVYQKVYADKKRRLVKFKPGQRVRLSQQNLPEIGASKAFKARFSGPYTIVETLGPNAAKLNLPKSLLIHPVFHASLLRPVVDEAADFRRPPPKQVPVRDDEYTLDAILAHKWSTKQQVRLFQVQWEDGSPTWEPEENLQSAQGPLQRHLCGVARASNIPGGRRGAPETRTLVVSSSQEERGVKDLHLRQQGLLAESCSEGGSETQQEGCKGSLRRT